MTHLKKPVIFGFCLLVLSSNGHADTLNVRVRNMTGQVINSMSAVPKGGSAKVAVISSSLASTAIAPASFAVPSDTCVFVLTTTLASGRVIVSPDTDLCQTDVIVVQ